MNAKVSGKDLIFVSSIQDEGTKLVSLSNDENKTLKSINSQFDLVLLSYKTGLYMAYNGYNFYIVKKDNGK